MADLRGVRTSVPATGRAARMGAATDNGRGDSRSAERYSLQAVTREPPLLVTVPEAARLLSVSRASAWRLVESGDLPSLKVEGNRRVRRAAIEAYVLALEESFSGAE